MIATNNNPPFQRLGAEMTVKFILSCIFINKNSTSMAIRNVATDSVS